MVYNFGKFRDNKLARAGAFRAGDAIKALGMRDMTSKIFVHGLSKMEVVLVQDPRYSGDADEKAVLDLLAKAEFVATDSVIKKPTFFINLQHGELTVDADEKSYSADWLTSETVRAA